LLTHGEAERGLVDLESHWFDRPMTASDFRRTVSLLIALAALTVAVGCGDDDESDSADRSRSRSSIEIEFAMVGIPGDPFYNVIKNGARQAGEDFGVGVSYKETSQYDFQEQKRLIEAAIAREPDALVVSNESPDVLDGPIKEAVDAGIPVMVTNAMGPETLEKTGALGFVGQDEFEVGQKAGERMRQEGIRTAYCINPAVGSVPLDARCRGLADVLGEDNAEVVATTLEDRTASKNRMKAALQREAVDGILVTAATVNGAQALQAVDETGLKDEVKIASIDLTPEVLAAVQNGDILFTSDQQQYLQGYLPVQILTLFLEYGLRPQPLTKTGPAYITADNAEQAIELSKRGIR
jgi:simple sugar transport system substrate-binding protein